MALKLVLVPKVAEFWPKASKERQLTSGSHDTEKSTKMGRRNPRLLKHRVPTFWFYV